MLHSLVDNFCFAVLALLSEDKNSFVAKSVSYLFPSSLHEIEVSFPVLADHMRMLKIDGHINYKDKPPYNWVGPFDYSLASGK